MFCINCSSKTKVINTRPHKKTPSTWRRRECTSCAALYTTWETVSDKEYELSVKDIEGLRRFSLPVLMISIYSALAHRNDEKGADNAYWLAQTVSEILSQESNRTITPLQIAVVTYDVLHRFDAVAALTYGTRHRVLKVGRANSPRRGRPRTRRET